MKVTISLDDELLARIDSYADETFMSRSGLISLSCVQYLNTYEGIKAIREMALAMRKIADKGEIDDETRQQLEDFERAAKMLAGVK